MSERLAQDWAKVSSYITIDKIDFSTYLQPPETSYGRSWTTVPVVDTQMNRWHWVVRLVKSWVQKKSSSHFSSHKNESYLIFEATMLFPSVLDERVFFCPAPALDCCRFPKKPVYFRIYFFYPAMFFFCFFFVALIIFFNKRTEVLYHPPAIN